MVQSNILSYLAVFGAFTLLFIVVPFWVMGLKFDIKNLIYNIFVSLMVSSVTIVVLIYILAALKILSFWPLLLSILLCIAVALLTVYRERTKRHVDAFTEFVYLMTKGVEKRKVFARKLRASAYTRFKEIIIQLFTNPATIIALIVGLIIMTVIRYYFNFTVMTFSYSDIYVHTNWTKLMLGGEMFVHDGVYPYGMHNMIAAISILFRMNLVTVIRFFGCVSGTYVTLSVFLVLKYMFKSQAAICIGFLIYTITDIVGAGAHSRLSSALPQEVGLLFLLPCAIFLFEYFKTKERLPLICAAIALSQTVAFHFYITILAVVMIGCIALVYFKDIIKKKMLGKLIIYAALGVVVGIAPLVIAVSSPNLVWNGSMYWAMDVLTGGRYSKENSEEEEITEEEVPEEVEEEEEAPSGPLRDTLYYKGMEIAAGFYNEHYLWPAFLCLIAMTIFAAVMLLFERWREYAKILLALALYSWGLMVLAAMPSFDLPAIIQKSRITEFFALNIGFIFASIAEIILLPLIAFPKLKAINYITGLFSIAGVLGTTYVTDHFQQYGYTYQDQYDGAVLTYYSIVENYPKDKWTIVSSVDELSMVRNLGWHTELTDFIYDLAEFKYGDGKPVYIPTNDVFFFIEKRPITPFRLLEATKYEFEPEAPVSEKFASMDTLAIKEDTKNQPSAAYTDKDYRHAIMSKAWYWAQEYQKYFPEMSEYYEDDDIIVYHLRQRDPYALCNFAIDYGFN